MEDRSQGIHRNISMYHFIVYVQSQTVVVCTLKPLGFDNVGCSLLSLLIKSLCICITFYCLRLIDECQLQIWFNCAVDSQESKVPLSLEAVVGNIGS